MSPITGTGRWIPTVSTAASSRAALTGLGSPIAERIQAAAVPSSTAQAPPGMRPGIFTRAK